MIQVEQLTKNFVQQKANLGFMNSILGLFSNNGKKFCAVDNVSFQIKEGDFVGYLGPNGAGKSTTIKMLTGILVPTYGKIIVNGIEPYSNRIQHSKNIGVVFGQRTQLWWDLPAIDAFYLLGKIYKITNHDLKYRIELFTDILQLAHFLNTPVRKLSLGQRMRCELTAAMLHQPKLLFLDEPTIGLDITAKESIRSFLKKINKEEQTTILLTTHDLSDVEELCKRIIVIDHGKIIHNSNLSGLRRIFGNKRLAIFDLEKETMLKLPDKAILTKCESKRVWIEFDGEQLRTPDLINSIMQQVTINDLYIKEIEIENVVKKIYNGSSQTMALA